MSRESKIIIFSLGGLALIVAGLFLFGAVGGGSDTPADDTAILKDTVEPDYGLLPEDSAETTDPVISEADQNNKKDYNKDNVVNVQDEFASVADTPTDSVVIEKSTVSSTTTSDSNGSGDISVPPPPPSVSGVTGLINRTSVLFRITGDLEAKYRCSMDREGFSGAKRCGEEREFKNLSEGPHVFRAWQITKNGVSGVEAARFWVDTNRPEPPRITLAPDPIINQRTATIRWSGNSKNDFICSLNYNGEGLDRRPCRMAINYKSMRDGRYSFSVQQIDRAGNYSSPSYVNWDVDTTIPRAPTILSGPANGSTTAADEVQYVFSGESNATFRCEMSGPGINSEEECTSPMLYLDLSPGVYSFSLRQQDLAGNWSPSITRSFTLAEVSIASRSSASAYRENKDYVDDSPSTPYSITAKTATDENTLTANVLAAIELGTVSDDTQSTAPVQGGSADATLTFDVSADLRSNLAWAVTSDTGTDSLEPTGVSSTDAPLLDDLVNVDVANDAGARNTSNAALEYDEQYTQDVSWGDEAGTYDIDLTHSAAQSLPS